MAFLLVCIFETNLHDLNVILFDTRPSLIFGVSNSNFSVGQKRTYKVTRGPHYDADETMALPEPYWKQLVTYYFLREVT